MYDDSMIIRYMARGAELHMMMRRRKGRMIVMMMMIRMMMIVMLMIEMMMIRMMMIRITMMTGLSRSIVCTACTS